MALIAHTVSPILGLFNTAGGLVGLKNPRNGKEHLISLALLALNAGNDVTTLPNGDQTVVSDDSSPFRTGSWPNLASGQIYTLAGDYVMYYWTHNTALDQNGDFVGRTDIGTCTIWMFTESGIIKIYNAPSAGIGVSPNGTWVLVSTHDTNSGIFSPGQATTGAAPAYVKGAMYFDTTLNKLRVGGVSAWETITSV